MERGKEGLRRHLLKSGGSQEQDVFARAQASNSGGRRLGQP